MSTRRERAKAQAKQPNSQPTTQEIRIVNVGQKSRKYTVGTVPTVYTGDTKENK